MLRRILRVGVIGRKRVQPDSFFQQRLMQRVIREFRPDLKQKMQA